MNFFQHIKFNFQSAMAVRRVGKTLDYSRFRDNAQWREVCHYLTDYEMLRIGWSKLLNSKFFDKKSNKNEIAVLALIRSLLIYNLENKYEGELKWYEKEERNFFNKTINEYISYMVNYLWTSRLEVSPGALAFHSYSSHLDSIQFQDLIHMDGFQDIIHQYLWVYFKTDDFVEIDISKEPIKNKDGLDTINPTSFLNQIDSIYLKSPNLGLMYDPLKKELDLQLMKIFMKSIGKVFDTENETFSLKKRF